MTGLTSVAFGPNDTWAVCEDADTTWSYGLPDNIYNTLDGRSKKRRCAPTNVAAMGHGNTYAIFATDTNWWSNHDDLVEQLNEHGIHGSDVKAVSFGDCGSYLLLLHNGACYWSGVNSRLNDLIQTESDIASIEWAVIGNDDSYFISYDDGRYFWGGGVADGLNKILGNENQKGIDKVWLSPFDCSYLILHSSGIRQWHASQSFSNNQYCNQWMNPRKILYTIDSIGQEFTCGRCIQDVADSLEKEKIQPDDLPCMHVFDWQGRTYSLNNRRLWVLSASGIDSTPVRYVIPPDNILSKLENGFQGTDIRLH